MEQKKALVVANLLKDDAEQLVSAIVARLLQSGFIVEKNCFQGPPSECSYTGIDIAFALGGDGTVLYASRIVPEKTPIFAINLGDVGFITEIARDEWELAFEKYMAGELGISRRILLDICVRRQGRDIVSFSGLNDAVVSSRGISKMVRLDVELDSTRLGRYRADGIIIATPTGSTAYSAAAGGPILFAEMNAMILTPICPFSLSNRPLVIPDSETVQVRVDEQQRTELILTIDGQQVFNLDPGDVICFSVSGREAWLIRSDKRTFYEVLRSKLNWSGGPDD
ncbi:MAG: NAD(+)/NADH kinase [Spirochaetales bacterium]|nr:NAD(+)/NADH kinase [Spirochaetales bacterium]